MTEFFGRHVPRKTHEAREQAAKDAAQAEQRRQRAETEHQSLLLLETALPYLETYAADLKVPVELERRGRFSRVPEIVGAWPIHAVKQSMDPLSGDPVTDPVTGRPVMEYERDKHNRPKPPIFYLGENGRIFQGGPTMRSGHPVIEVPDWQRRLPTITEYREELDRRNITEPVLERVGMSEGTLTAQVYGFLQEPEKVEASIAQLFVEDTPPPQIASPDWTAKPQRYL